MTIRIISLLVFDLGKGLRKSILIESHDRERISNDYNIPAES